MANILKFPHTNTQASIAYTYDPSIDPKHPYGFMIGSMDVWLDRAEYLAFVADLIDQLNEEAN